MPATVRHRLRLPRRSGSMPRPCVAAFAGSTPKGSSLWRTTPVRGGRATYSADAVAAVIAAALTSPRRLDLPFASWTLDRLAAYLRDHRGIAMRRSRIDEILLREGLRWRRPGGLVRRTGRPRVRVRGGLRRSTPDRPRAASVSV